MKTACQRSAACQPRIDEYIHANHESRSGTGNDSADRIHERDCSIGNGWRRMLQELGRAGVAAHVRRAHLLHLRCDVVRSSRQRPSPETKNLCSVIQPGPGSGGLPLGDSACGSVAPTFHPKGTVRVRIPAKGWTAEHGCDVFWPCPSTSRIPLDLVAESRVYWEYGCRW